jgi:hypothetical protein
MAIVNTEQAKSAVRSLVATFGGLVAGWFAAKGWFTIDQVTSVLSSETTISILASAAVFVWGLFVHTQANAIAVVAPIATGQAGPIAVEAQKALISATAAVAHDSSIPKSTEAKAALLDAVAAQPEVVGKISVTDAAVVDATMSPQIQKVPA